MAISFVGVQYTKSTSEDGSGALTINIPSYEVGDLVVAVAGHDGQWPEQEVPSGFTKINNFPSKDWTAATDADRSQDYWYSITAYKFMTNTSQTQITWDTAYSQTSNPTFSFCAVYRGVESIGNWDARSTDGSSSTTPSIQAMSVNDSRSWAVLFTLLRNNTTISSAPDEEFTTQRQAANESTSIPTANQGFAAYMHDTGGPVSSISADTMTLAGTTGWYTMQFELIAKAATKGRAVFMF